MKIIKNKFCCILILWLFAFSFIADAQYYGKGNKIPRLVVPFGHQLGIDKHLFSNNNELIFTSDQEITIIWDVRSGKPLHYLRGINPVISTDDKYLATIAGTRVLVWTVEGAKLITELNQNSPVKYITFNPGKNQLLVYYLSENSDVDEEDDISGLMVHKKTDYTYDIAVWDFKSSSLLHTFRSEEPMANCNDCSPQKTPIKAGWFNNSGDSIRIIYNSYIATYSLTDYRFKKWFFTDKLSIGPHYIIKNILNNHILEILNEDAGTVTFINESGKIVASWNVPEQEEGAKDLFSNRQELISADFRFYASYGANDILLHDLLKQKELIAEVEGVKNLSFNRNSSLVLVEFLNESPRVFETSNFQEVSKLSEQNMEGLPIYVFATKTLGDSAVSANLGKARQSAKITGKHAKNGIDKVAGDFFNKTINDVLGSFVGNMENQAKNAYTNSGEIINLYNGRTISKIESLIKMSGDMKLSPDRKYLLVNNKENIAVYSIQQARQVGSLPVTNSSNIVFSPNSKYLIHYQPLADTLSVYDLKSGKSKKYNCKITGQKVGRILFVNNNTTAIGNEDGIAKLINLGNGAELRKGGSMWGYCISANGLLYGYTSRTDGSVHVYRQKDSAEIFSVKLKIGKNGAIPSNPYQIEFGADPNSLAIWNSKKVVYYKDIRRPNDTLELNDTGKKSNEENRQYLSKILISPDSKYLFVQSNTGAGAVFNAEKKTISFTIAEELEETNPDNKLLKKGIGGTMRELENGNTKELGVLSEAKEMAEFSASGDSLLFCNDDSVTIYQISSGLAIKSFKVDGDIRYFSLNNNLIISYYYGQLKFYRINEQKEWFKILPFNNNENVFLLTDGKYFGKNSVTRNLGYIYDDKSLSYKQFDNRNNRPDIVLRVLGNTEPEYLDFYDKMMSMQRSREETRNTDMTDFDKSPEIKIVNEREIPGEVKERALKIKVNINGNGRNLQKLAVFINGNPAFGLKGISLSGKAGSFDTSLNLNLSEGLNLIEASVFDVAGTESYRQPIYVRYVPENSVVKNIFLVGVGAAKYTTPGKELKYPYKDVMELYDTLKRWYPNRVHLDTLFGSRVTVENLMRLKGSLQQSKTDDIVIVYYSGHGEIDIPKAEAFFGTYDIDFTKPSVKGISINHLDELMNDIPSRNKAIFLDACHSGEIYRKYWSQENADKNKNKAAKITAATSNDVLNRLAEKGEVIEIASPAQTDMFDLVLETFTDHYQGNGTNIIVAARGLGVAKECDQLEHGVFTFSVLKGMSQLAGDLDKDEKLSISELRNFVLENVNLYSKICDSQIIQRASSREENEYNDWILLDNSKYSVKRKSQVKVVQTEFQSGQVPVQSPAGTPQNSNKETKNKKETVKEPDTPVEGPGKEIQDLINGALKKIPIKLPKRKKGG